MEYVRFGSWDRYLQVNVHNVEMKQLFGYSQNIVDGMEYLTHNKIINRTHPSCGVVNSTVPSEFTLPCFCLC